MASFDSSGWGAGATVTVYARDAFGNATGSSVTSATASSAGVASFSGLADSGKYVATDGSRTVKFGTPPASSSSGSSSGRGTRAVANGDSITAGSGNDPVNNIVGSAWPAFLALASAGRVKLLRNSAIGGQTSAQVLARTAADVLAYNPAIGPLLFGTNDAEPLPTLANYIAAIQQYKAAGVKPMIATIPPYGTAALAAPVPALITATTGGTLAPATYSYRVSAVNGVGETLASTAATIVVPAGTSTNTVTVSWPAVPGATGYKVYGRTGGSELLMATLSASGLDRADSGWLDTGSVTPSGALPGSNTTAVAYNATFAAKQSKVNEIAHRLAEFYDLPIVDFYGLLVDGATGMYRTGATIDGTHPTPREHRRMGEAYATAAKDYLPPGAVNLPGDNYDTTLVNPDPLLAGGSADVPGTGGGSPEFPAWTSYNTGTPLPPAYGPENMTTDALVLGKVLEITRIDHYQHFTESPAIGPTAVGIADVTQNNATLTNATYSAGVLAINDTLSNATCTALGVANGTTITAVSRTGRTITLSNAPTVATQTRVTITTTRTLWTPGDTLQFCGMIKASGLDTGGGQVSIAIKPAGGSGSPTNVTGLYLQSDTPASGWVPFCLEGQIRAGVTALTIIIATRGGSQVSSFGQLALRNMTALGLASV